MELAAAHLPRRGSSLAQEDGKSYTARIRSEVKKIQRLHLAAAEQLIKSGTTDQLVIAGRKAKRQWEETIEGLHLLEARLQKDREAVNA